MPNPDLEAIHYDLVYYGDDVFVDSWIVQTIARLPQEIREFALDRCVYLSIGRVNFGMVLPGSVGAHRYEGTADNMWIVLLAENLREEDAHGIVAHEIAHAWLKHDQFDMQIQAKGQVVEEEAAELVRKWGFSGRGAVATPPRDDED